MFFAKSMTKLLKVFKVALALITVLAFVKTNANSIKTTNSTPAVFFSNFLVMPVQSTGYWKTVHLSLTLPPSESNNYHSKVLIQTIGSSNDRICFIKFKDCAPFDRDSGGTQPTNKCLCEPREGDVYQLFVQRKAEMTRGKTVLKASLEADVLERLTVYSVEKELPRFLSNCTDKNPCNGHECHQDYKEDNTNDGQKKKREDEKVYQCNCEENDQGYLIENKQDWKKGKRCQDAHPCSDEDVHKCTASNKVCERKTNSTDDFQCEQSKLTTTEGRSNNVVPSEASPGKEMMLNQVIGWLFVLFAKLYFLPTLFGESFFLW